MHNARKNLKKKIEPDEGFFVFFVNRLTKIRSETQRGNLESYSESYHCTRLTLLARSTRRPRRPGSPSPVFLGLLLASRPASSAAALTGGGAEAELSALGGDVSMLSELLPLGSTVAHADYVALLSPALW